MLKCVARKDAVNALIAKWKLSTIIARGIVMNSDGVGENRNGVRLVALVSDVKDDLSKHIFLKETALETSMKG